MYLDIEIGRDNSRLLTVFDGSSPALDIRSIEANSDSAGRILVLRNGSAVNQVRERGKWKCIAFVGAVPSGLVDRCSQAMGR